MRLAPLMILCAALCAAAPLAAARIEPAAHLVPSTQMPEGNGPWVVRAHFDSDSSLALLMRRAAPWRVDRRAGVLIIEVDNRFEYRRLLDEGFRVAIDPELTQAVYAPVPVSPDQITGIPGYACYRTVEESIASAQQLVAQHPEVAELVDIGDSWKKAQNPALGHDLWVLRLTNRSIGGTKPVHYLQGALHAREYATAETVLRYGEWLAGQYGNNPDVTWVLDHHEVHILLHANPDGRKIAEVSTTRMQRKNRNENHCPTGGTSLGVDLNRNFPFDWAGPGSSGSDCSDLFRGPTPSSEVESQAIITYLRSIFPDQRAEGPGVDLVTPISADATGVYMDVHSNAATTWWSWGNSSVLAPNAVALQTLGRKIAYYNGLTPEQGSLGGAIGGATDDFAYGTLGVAAFTIEMGGSSFFPSCTTFESSLVQPVVNGFWMASKLARAPYRWAAGPELTNLAAAPAGATVTLTARADDARFNNSEGAEPAQTVTGIAVYLQPPWQPGVAPLAQMQPVDGAWNATAENASVEIPAAALQSGRQLVYLRATDAAGNQGPVAAVFVTVGAPDPLFANGFE